MPTTICQDCGNSIHYVRPKGATSFSIPKICDGCVVREYVMPCATCMDCGSTEDVFPSPANTNPGRE